MSFRTPQSWLEHGIVDGVKYPIPGEAFLPISSKTEVPAHVTDSANFLYEWVNVAINSYNSETKLWTVVSLDGLLRKFHIPRIHLMFKAEDPENFMRRIEAAINLRNEVESRIRFSLFFYLDCRILLFFENYRYELYLDCMLAVGTVDIDPEWINILISLAKRGQSIIKVEYFIPKVC